MAPTSPPKHTHHTPCTSGRLTVIGWSENRALVRRLELLLLPPVSLRPEAPPPDPPLLDALPRSELPRAVLPRAELPPV